MFIGCQEKNEPFVHEHAVSLPFMELTLREQERLRDRLRQEMHRRDLLQKDFAKLLGIRPTYLSYILSGKRAGARKLVDFAKRLKVPIGYLLGLENLPDFVTIPLVAGHIAANPKGEITGDMIENFLYLPAANLHGRRNLIAVSLGPEARSMEPNLHPGDHIIIDRDDREFSTRGLFAVRLPDLESCAVKRLGKLPDGKHILLISDNPDYPPKAVEWHEHLLIGRVVWSLTKWINKD